MIKKILLIFGVVVLCLFLPFTCSYCTARAEEKNNISLTALTDGVVDGNSSVYYLLGGLPVQTSNDNSISISTQSIVLYNEYITNNAYGDIWETKLIVPVLTGNNSSSVVSVSLGQNGTLERVFNGQTYMEEVIVPTGVSSFDIALNGGKAEERDNLTSMRVECQFWSIQGDLTQYYDNFEQVLRSVNMVKRFNYVNQGNYYCAYQFFVEDEAIVQLYFKLRYDYNFDNIKSYESWFYPQSTLDLRDYIQAEANAEYNRGYTDGYNSREPFFTIVNGVNEFLGVRLFGSFTIGTMLGIVISISMLFIGLHIFRG